MTTSARLAWGAGSLLMLLALAPATAQTADGDCVDDLAITVDHDARIVTLTWSATPGAAFYDVHRAVDGGPSEHIATVDGDTTSFVDSPAPEGVVEYRVAADGHPSLDCPAVSAHLGGEPVPPGEPVCVGGLTAEALPDGPIRIDWPAIPGVTTYEILRATGDAPLVPYAVIGTGATTFTDTATEPGVVHRYAVVANGLPPEGVACEEASVVAVPYFPGLALALGLSALGAAGVALLRRR